MIDLSKLHRYNKKIYRNNLPLNTNNRCLRAILSLMVTNGSGFPLTLTLSNSTNQPHTFTWTAPRPFKCAPVAKKSSAKNKSPSVSALPPSYNLANKYPCSSTSSKPLPSFSSGWPSPKLVAITFVTLFNLIVRLSMLGSTFLN